MKHLTNTFLLFSADRLHHHRLHGLGPGYIRDCQQVLGWNVGKSRPNIFQPVASFKTTGCQIPFAKVVFKVFLRIGGI